VGSETSKKSVDGMDVFGRILMCFRTITWRVGLIGAIVMETLLRRARSCRAHWFSCGKGRRGREMGTSPDTFLLRISYISCSLKTMMLIFLSFPSASALIPSKPIILNRYRRVRRNTRSQDRPLNPRSS
jgi:hypothetical protein